MYMYMYINLLGSPTSLEGWSSTPGLVLGGL